MKMETPDVCARLLAWQAHEVGFPSTSHAVPNATVRSPASKQPHAHTQPRARTNAQSRRDGRNHAHARTRTPSRRDGRRRACNPTVRHHLARATDPGLGGSEVTLPSAGSPRLLARRHARLLARNGRRRARRQRAGVHAARTQRRRSRACHGSRGGKLRGHRCLPVPKSAGAATPRRVERRRAREPGA